VFGVTGAGYNARTLLRNCDWDNDDSGAHTIQAYNGLTEWIGGTFADATPPSILVSAIGGRGDVTFRFVGVDLSALTNTTIFTGAAATPFHGEIVGCKLHSGSLSVTSSPSIGVEVFVIDSHSGDTHYVFEHKNTYGSLTVSAATGGIYATDGAAFNDAGTQYSWAITTTASASYHAPYISPWISAYNETVTGITPSIEVVRSGSSTAFKESELWSEWLYKSAGGSPLMALNVADRGGQVPSTTNQATGALGASDWNNENATAWFGKLSPGSITPAEIGDISARVCFAVASSTVYVDPQIRGL
jgi:hypothetical protein